MTPLTTCSQNGCNATELRCYRTYLRRTFTLLCEDCATRLIGLGMSLEPVERRVVDLPVIVERRHIRRPVWLRNLTAKVLDHGIAA